MIIADEAVLALKKQANHQLSRNIHPEDAKVYQKGLEDGTSILAEWVLSHLKEEVILPPRREERIEEGIEESE